jgi:uncharacterized membrane protein
MTLLILGLVLFLGIHFSRVFFEGPRARFIAQRGEKTWKGMYSLISLAGFALIIWGYGQARLSPTVLWAPMPGAAHMAALLTLIAFVLFAAAYVPGNAIKAAVGHPMLLGTKVWALAHLLANGNLADLLLFGGFLVWAALAFRSARQRDRAAPPAKAAVPTAAATSLTIGAGAAVWAVFALYLHQVLIGVKPLG